MAKYKRTVSLIDPPEKYRGPWVKEDFVKHCPHLFQEGTTVLDVGCGSADIKGFLSEGVTYIGIDHIGDIRDHLSEKMAEIFIDQFPEIINNPDIVCDAGSVPLDDGCADTIMALGLDVLEVPGAISEIKRLLKDGGRFVFQGSSEYFCDNNIRTRLRDSGFHIEEEFRQVLKYPGDNHRLVYYICTLN